MFSDFRSFRLGGLALCCFVEGEKPLAQYSFRAHGAFATTLQLLLKFPILHPFNVSLSAAAPECLKLKKRSFHVLSSQKPRCRQTVADAFDDGERFWRPQPEGRLQAETNGFVGGVHQAGVDALVQKHRHGPLGT